MKYKNRNKKPPEKANKLFPTFSVVQMYIFLKIYFCEKREKSGGLFFYFFKFLLATGYVPHIHVVHDVYNSSR